MRSRRGKKKAASNGLCRGRLGSRGLVPALRGRHNRRSRLHHPPGTKHALPAYDAAYLSLAISHNVPLATHDRKLAAAAKLENVAFA
ncbi:hypothetical protein AGR1A_Cc20819 [Agrobacterium fabacearum CFBP 5771]|nr:hypothetical protein AGR1A_Cc20819 [Agrobacterium fabacearum CFBP 5771]